MNVTLSVIKLKLFVLMAVENLIVEACDIRYASEVLNYGLLVQIRPSKTVFRKMQTDILLNLLVRCFQ